MARIGRALRGRHAVVVGVCAVAIVVVASLWNTGAVGTSVENTAITAPVVVPGEFEPQDAVYQELTDLKSAVNLTFGFSAGHPRIDLGPCGAFAKEFHDAWNERFDKSARVAFVMILSGRVCRHILVQLPNGLFFDGEWIKTVKPRPAEEPRRTAATKVSRPSSNITGRTACRYSSKRLSSPAKPSSPPVHPMSLRSTNHSAMPRWN